MRHDTIPTAAIRDSHAARKKKSTYPPSLVSTFSVLFFVGPGAGAGTQDAGLGEK